MYICMCVYTYVYMHVYVCINTYICIYIYMHTFVYESLRPLTGLSEGGRRRLASPGPGLPRAARDWRGWAGTGPPKSRPT